MGGVEKTETSAEFKQLQDETEGEKVKLVIVVRRGCLERIHSAVTILYLATNQKSYKTVSKKKDLGEGERLLPSLLAGYMTAYGSVLTDEILYGKILMRVGSYHEKVAVEQAVFVYSII